MNELLGRLHAALIRQRQFVADTSHELRTPLAVLCGELELAARPGRGLEELAAAVASAADEANRLKRLTNDMLLLARTDEGMLVLEPEAVSIRDLLERSVTRAQLPAISVALNAPHGLTGYVDPERIRQAVDNLLDNALRFAPEGSQVSISAQADGPDLMISISDAGPGFPCRLPARTRSTDSPGRAAEADPDRMAAPGSGLAIVGAIASAHGGSASAANRAEGGAEVTMRMPRSVLLP